MDKQSNSTVVPSISSLIAGTIHSSFTHEMTLESLKPLQAEDMDAMIDVLSALNDAVCAFSNQPRFLQPSGCLFNAVGELVASLGTHLSNCISLVEQAAVDHAPQTTADVKNRAWILIKRAANYSEDLAGFAAVVSQLAGAADTTAKIPTESVTASSSLSYALYRYRADWNDFLAASVAADELGDPNVILPTDHKASERIIANWNRPAASVAEAEQALELAIQDHDIGDTPRIPAMMKAALGWIRAERERRMAQ